MDAGSKSKGLLRMLVKTQIIKMQSNGCLGMGLLMDMGGELSLLTQRVEFLKMLFETLSIDEDVYSGSLFKDVDENEWYTSYVRAAKARNTINGYSDGTFRHSNCVNRVEALKMAMIEFDIELGIPDDNGYSFTDVDPDGWYIEYFESALFKNLLPLNHEGKDYKNYVYDQPGRMYFPAQPMTRKEVAELLYRMKAFKDYEVDEYSSFNETSVPKDLEGIGYDLDDEIAFDGCRNVNEYTDQEWYLRFTNIWPQLEGPRRDTKEFLENKSEGCLSLDDKVFVYFLGNSEYFSNDSKMYRYLVEKNTIEEASYEGFDVGEGGITISEFKNREGEFINMVGLEGDAQGGRKWVMKYYYGDNILKLVRTCDVDITEKESNCGYPN